MTRNSEAACLEMIRVGVSNVLALPDSLLSPLCTQVARTPELNYIQVTHEATAVAVAAGLGLCGARTLIMMENSGLRTACETLARFNISHHLFTCLLISDRGAFGERNWWGLAHHDTMQPLLQVLRIRYRQIGCLSDFGSALHWAFETLSAGQCSVALVAERTFTDSLRGNE